MKIQMLCFYKDYVQGEIYNLEEEEARKLIGNKLAMEYDGKETAKKVLEETQKIIVNKSNQKYDSTDVKKDTDESVAWGKSKNIRWKNI